MSYKRVILISLLMAALGCGAATAQADSPVTWQEDLRYLQQLTPAEAAAQQGSLLHIREAIQLWLNTHPKSGLTMAPAPGATLSPEQAAAQVKLLSQLVGQILQLDASHPFHLGVTEVEVSAKLSALSPMAESISQEEIQLHNATNVSKAIELLPGVEIYHMASNRNEAAFMIRGFSSNGQVPIYQDGIPIYVPYDGYIDLNRFQTSDLAEVQVARGYSSPLLGPNALGGSVNLVTRQPRKLFEGDAGIGGFSGDGLLASLRLGSHGKQYLAQATLDWLQNDFVPLSGNLKYPTTGYTGLNTLPNVAYPLTHHENNSASRDERWSGRLGWLPKQGDQYVFSYINQKGAKGVPLYMGANAAYTFKNFWKWPYWNKDSYYFLSETQLPGQSSLKTRVYYDQFRNSIDMYDNSQYNSMTKYTASNGSGSEISSYDDHTDGASAEFNTRKVRRNVISVSGFFKDDTHKEKGIYPGAATVFPTIPAAEYIPVKQLRDQQTSFAAQDEITLSERLHATVGFSADHLKGLLAETYSNYIKATNTPANISLIPYLCAASPANTSFSGCTAHYWNVNPQASASYSVTASDVVFVTFADRGRFPTLKQRYSSGMGSAIPNPDLKTEHSRNWNVGYTHNFGVKTVASLQLFRSDLRNAIESATVPDPNYNATTDPKDLLGLCPSNSNIGHCSQNINVGKETHQGVEFEVRSTPVKWVSVDANYTYLNRTIGVATIPTGVTVSTLALPLGVPRNKAVATAVFQLPGHANVSVTERYEGGITLQDTSYASTSALYAPYKEAHSVTDLGLQLPITDRFVTQIGAKNIFDRNYFYSAGFPEAGRNWYVNMRYRF